MVFVPEGEQVMEDQGGETVPLSAFRAYDLPLVEALVIFFMQLQGTRSKVLGREQSRRNTLIVDVD